MLFKVKGKNGKGLSSRRRFLSGWNVSWRGLRLPVSGDSSPVSRIIGLTLGFLVLCLCMAGMLRGSAAAAFPQVISLLFLVSFLVLRLMERWRAPIDTEDLEWERTATATEARPGSSRVVRIPLLQEMELGTLLLAATYVMVEASGGGTTPLFPLVYLLVFLLGGYTSWQCGLYLVFLATLVELGTYRVYPVEPFSPLVLTLRVVLIWAFGALYRMLLYGEALQRSRLFQRSLADHIRKMHDDARLFRLDAASKHDPRERFGLEDRDLRHLAAVGSVRSGLNNMLQMSAMGFLPRLHSLVLFLLDDDYFILRKAVSPSNSLAKGPIPRGQGIFGMVEKKRGPVLLEEIKSKRGVLSYYRLPVKISCLAALPLLWEEKLIGVLLADRKDKHPFSPEEVQELTLLAKEVVRLLEFELILSDLQTKKRAYEKFHKIAHEFNRLTRIDEVALAAIEAAQDISGAPFAAMTAHDAEEKEDTVIVAKWNDQVLDHLSGHRLDPSSGLVSKVVKLGCPLPESPLLTPRQVIFGPSVPTEGIKAAKVFPLQSKEAVIGTLVVGDSSPNFLSPHLQSMIEVIADQSALAVSQAISYERMEMMATTDGLTGLTNHRYFHVKFEEAFRRAIRYQQHLTLLIMDLDHFKTINDNYGHPAGDKVLQGIAEILFQLSRQTDIVARYGGEEFAIIMEQTDSTGAVTAAERIRETVAKREFRFPEGIFRCSLSIGVASYPDHAPDRMSLVASADQALYKAKDLGRNQVVVHGQ